MNVHYPICPHIVISHLNHKIYKNTFIGSIYRDFYSTLFRKDKYRKLLFNVPFHLRHFLFLISKVQKTICIYLIRTLLQKIFSSHHLYLGQQKNNTFNNNSKKNSFLVVGSRWWWWLLLQPIEQDQKSCCNLDRNVIRVGRNKAFQPV